MIDIKSELSKLLTVIDKIEFNETDDYYIFYFKCLFYLLYSNIKLYRKFKNICLTLRSWFLQKIFVVSWKMMSFLCVRAIHPQNLKSLRPYWWQNFHFFEISYYWASEIQAKDNFFKIFSKVTIQKVIIHFQRIISN